MEWFESGTLIFFYKTTSADMNQKTSTLQYPSMEMWRKGCQNYQKDVSIHATLKKNEVWLL